MGKIAKWLRWFFGFEALLAGSILPRYVWEFWLPIRDGLWFQSASVVPRVLLDLALIGIFAMAWWSLRTGKSPARGWAILASVVSTK